MEPGDATNAAVEDPPFPPAILGIDFGTSNSAVSIWRTDLNLVKTIKFKTECPVVASTVLFRDGFSDYAVGVDPLLHTNDGELKRVISHIKPILGKESMEDIYLYEHMQLVERDRIMIACEDQNEQSKLFPPEELTAMVLRALRENAVNYVAKNPHTLQLNPNNGRREVIDRKLRRVVLGVPANSTEKFKLALRKAAHLAGFEEAHFMIESTAAALSYGLCLSGVKRILIFDIGGGTADLTILEVSSKALEVVWTAGNDHLGGRMIDNLLFHWVLTQKLLPQGLVPDAYKSQDYTQWRNSLLRACRVCKEELSSATEATLRLSRASLPHLLSDSKNVSPPTPPILGAPTVSAEVQSPDDIEIVVHRSDLEAAIAPALGLVERLIFDSLQSLQTKLDAAKSSQPTHAGAVEHQTGEDVLSECGSHSEEGTADPTDGDLNSTLSSSVASLASLTVTSSPVVAPSPVFPLLIDEVVLVGGCSRIPAIQQSIVRACQRASLSHIASPQHLCMALDPETVVSQGLVVQAARTCGAVTDAVIQDLLVFDCLPRTLGLAVWDERAEDYGDKRSRYFEPLIAMGTKVPVRVTKRFQLASPTQTSVTLDVYEEFQRHLDDAAREEGGEELKYSLVMSMDVPIEQRDEGDQPRRFVDVIFHVNANQELSYQVVQASHDLPGASAPVHLTLIDQKLAQDESSRRINMLALCIVLLVVLYIACKYLLVNVSSTDAMKVLEQVKVAQSGLGTCLIVLGRDLSRCWGKLRDHWKVISSIYGVPS